MIYLIWSIINFGLIIYFFKICYNAIKLVKEKMGLFSAIFLVFGFLSFLSLANSSNPNESNSDLFNSWEFASKDTLSNKGMLSIKIELEKNLVSTKYLRIQYGKDVHGKINIPQSASTSESGFSSGGATWEPSSVKVFNASDKDEFEYYVDGIVCWRLLGATFFTQSKDFKGIVRTDKGSR